jgi:hypothetical protein
LRDQGDTYVAVVSSNLHHGGVVVYGTKAKMDYSGLRQESEDANSQYSKHKIIYSRNNTINSDYSGAIIPNEEDDSITYYCQSEHEEIGRSARILYSDINSSTNYIYFCIGFSLSSAPVISSLLYAPAVIGHENGGIGNGLFYLAYAAFSLFISKPLVTLLGCKNSFFVGLGGNVIFLSVFTLFVKHSSMAVGIYYAGSMVGGLAQGLLWSAHNKYFSKSCQMIVPSMDVKAIENTNRALASKFASILFLFLIVLFVASTLMAADPARLERPILIILPSFLALSLISLCFLCRLDSYGDAGESWRSFRPKRGLMDMVVAIRSLPSSMRTKLVL